MTDCFLGELRIFSSATTNNIPAGWLPCEGQILQVSQYSALYALLGNQFGGTQPSTFALPDLRGRIIVAAHPVSGQPFATVGNKGGTEGVLLTQTQVPTHTHQVNASTATDTPAPVPNNNYIGVASKGAIALAAPLYTSVTTPNDMVPLALASLSGAGGGMPHENRQPVLALRICIATSGIFPPRQ